MSTTARPPTASELLFVLLSDHVPSEAISDPRARDLGSQLRDKRGPAATLVSAALWSLNQSGGVDLEVRKGKSLGFISKTELVATSGASNGTAGIEAELRQELSKRSPRSVEDLVKDWFGNKVANVQAAVTERVLGHAADAGLVEVRTETQERGKIGGALLGKTKEKTAVHPNATILERESAAIANAGTAWVAFTREGGDLADELVKRVAKALTGREKEQRSGGDFD